MATPSEIVPGYWVFHSRAMAYNAGLIVRDGLAALIDPGPHRDEIEAIAAFTTAQGATIELILLTHSHWDHILGPERLPPARIVVQQRYPEITAAFGERITAHIRRWEQRHAYGRPTPFQIPQPDLAAEHATNLAFGGSNLHLLHIPGHADDHMAIFEPASGVLWAADTLSDLEIPFISESLADYEIALERMAALDIRALIPGHGSATPDTGEIQSRISQDRAYLATLRERIGQVIAAGGSIDDAKRACALELRHPDVNSGAHRMNVESAYIELGGPADPDLVGWKQNGLWDE
ncbi:MAG: MBL fold metallo-hydrolase [Oscillochloris sp.]|nr:MBL fold metallo-hydrolase [Oscillochloris sp.]